MQVPRWKVAVWVAVIASVARTTFAIVGYVRRTHRIVLQGAVIREDSDPNKQLPIANVAITATADSWVSQAKSDASGFFTLTLPRGFRRRQSLLLQFRHSDYYPLDDKDFVEHKLYVVYMKPVSTKQHVSNDHPDVLISNVRVRYSVKTTTTPDVGSAIKTFQVVNAGNVACRKQHPCSPDGKWKAAIASTSLDAGDGNEFRDARATCLAGSCPFARIEYENLSRDGRMMSVSVRNWSDTVTFVLEAEVVHPMESDIVRESYPVIFGRTLSFTVQVRPRVQASKPKSMETPWCFLWA